MASSELLCVRWNEFGSTLGKALSQLRQHEDTCDVNLVLMSNEAKEDLPLLHAHSFILSACSSFFRRVLSRTSGKRVLVLHDVEVAAMNALLEFMYCGEVRVEQNCIKAFLEAAEYLGVEGLTESQTKKKKKPMVVAMPSLLKKGSENRKRVVKHDDFNDDKNFEDDSDDPKDEDYRPGGGKRRLKVVKQERRDDDSINGVNDNEDNGDVKVDNVVINEMFVDQIKEENASTAGVVNFDELVSQTLDLDANNPLQETEVKNEPGPSKEVKGGTRGEVQGNTAEDPQTLVELSNAFYDCIGRNRERAPEGGYTCLVCCGHQSSNGSSVRHFLSLHLQDESKMMRRLDAFVNENATQLGKRHWMCSICDKELKVLRREVQTHFILKHLSSYL